MQDLIDNKLATITCVMSFDGLAVLELRLLEYFNVRSHIMLCKLYVPILVVNTAYIILHSSL